jgi:hypothetical protein
MLALYLFSLFLGGGLLAASLLGAIGGHEFGGHDHGAIGGHGADPSADHAAAKIFSVRALIYGLFGFGAAGSLLTALQAGSFLTAIAAVVTGAVSAVMVTALFRLVRAEELPPALGDESYIGLAGRVTLPMQPGSPGTIAVDQGARRITLRALPHPSRTGVNTGAWKAVVVVDMEHGVARVVPVEDDLIPEP